MREDIKAKWVVKLRSGEYRQGRGALSRDGKFCCLGVLCELAVEEGVTKRGTRANSVIAYGPRAEVYSSLSATYLPKAVAEWAGFTDHWGISGQNPVAPGVGSSLSSLNDSGKTFAQIADIIEENF